MVITDAYKKIGSAKGGDLFRRQRHAHQRQRRAVQCRLRHRRIEKFARRSAGEISSRKRAQAVEALSAQTVSNHFNQRHRAQATRTMKYLSVDFSTVDSCQRSPFSRPARDVSGHAARRPVSNSPSATGRTHRTGSQVSPTNFYSAETGYGFEPGAEVGGTEITSPATSRFIFPSNCRKEITRSPRCSATRPANP